MVRHLHKGHELLTVLDQPTAALAQLRGLLTLPAGRYPTRRTWERRLATLPETLPPPIGSLGRPVVARRQPWAACGRAVAVARTRLRAKGGVWHKNDRAAGVVPHTSIDTAAHWTKSGWHGWVYGWKRHRVTTVAAVWLPLAAALTPADAADNAVAALLLPDLPAAVRFVLGDQHDNAPHVRALCAEADRVLVASRHGGYPHQGDGGAVRRVFHKLRSAAIETCNEQFKGLFAAHGPVPTNGLVATQRCARGAILVDQLLLRHRHEHGLARRRGLKPALKAA